MFQSTRPHGARLPKNKSMILKCYFLFFRLSLRNLYQPYSVFKELYG
jgi:hypothetical protein